MVGWSYYCCLVHVWGVELLIHECCCSLCLVPCRVQRTHPTRLKSGSFMLLMWVLTEWLSSLSVCVLRCNTSRASFISFSVKAALRILPLLSLFCPLSLLCFLSTLFLSISPSLNSSPTRWITRARGRSWAQRPSTWSAMPPPCPSTTTSSCSWNQCPARSSESSSTSPSAPCCSRRERPRECIENQCILCAYMCLFGTEESTWSVIGL